MNKLYKGTLFLFLSISISITTSAQTYEDLVRRVASDAATVTNFGQSVSISGDYAVVGAPFESDGFTHTGAAYIFYRNEGGTNNWGEIKKITASDKQESDQFGRSVAISGDYILVGAPLEDGNQQNSNTGAAYLFYKNHGGDNNWGEIQKMIPADLPTGSFYGEDIDLHGSTAIIGARIADSGAGVNSGAAYLFEGVDGSTPWAEGKMLVGSTTIAGDALGGGVAIHGDNAIVSSGRTGINPGRVYTFNRNKGGEGNWGEVDILDAAANEEELRYGFKVDIWENFAVVTSISSDTDSTEGAAFLFEFDSNDTTWTEGKTVTDSNESQDTFGFTVSLADGRLGVGGALNEVLVFGQDQGGTNNWGLIERLVQFDDEVLSNTFNEAFSISGNNVVVGSFGENTSTGAVYFYREVNFITSESELDFGTVDITREETLEITVYNTAQTAQDIVGASLNTSVFDFWIDDESLEPGDSTTIEISFEPIEGTTANDTLRFSDTDGNDYIVALVATGQMPYVAMTEQFTEVVFPSYVNVLFQLSDQSGRGISGFDETTFYQFLENGSPISETESIPQIGSLDELPIKVRTVLLLDNSFSIGLNLDSVKFAASTLVENRFDEQEIAIYTFNEGIDLIQSFTTDTDSLLDAINSISLGAASTNLFGAVVEGMNSFETIFATSGIEDGFAVLFTDGEDTQGSSTLNEALLARGDKKLFAVGIGASADVNTLDQLQNFGLFTPDDFAGLPEVFLDIQQEIIDYANSFYWLSYISPKRGDNFHTLRISLNDNPNGGLDSFIETTFNSDGFSSVQPGVYVNRTFENLNGIDTLIVGSTNTSELTAESLFGILDPNYTWSSLTPSLVEVIADEFDNAYASVTAVGTTGEFGQIQVTDTENGFNKTVVIQIGMTIVSSEEESTPVEYNLSQNYPNPFNPSTSISFVLPQATQVELTVFDITGRLVSTVVDGRLGSGSHTVRFDASALSSGVYFYRLEAGDFVSTKKMTLIK